MNYKDTILKDIDWKSNLEVKHDESNDVRINILLDKVLDIQAKRSFAYGIWEMVEFIKNAPKDGDIDKLFKAKMKEWGLK